MMFKAHYVHISCWLLGWGWHCPEKFGWHNCNCNKCEHPLFIYIKGYGVSLQLFAELTGQLKSLLDTSSAWAFHWLKHAKKFLTHMDFFWYMLELCFKASASGWRWVGWALIKVSIVDWKCYWWPDPCSQAALNSCPTSWFSPPLHFHLHVVVFDWVDQLVCIRRLCPRIGNGGDSLLVQYHLLFVRQEDFKLAVDDLLNFSLWIILCVGLWHKLRPTWDQDCGSSVAQLLPSDELKLNFLRNLAPGKWPPP